MRPWGGGWRNDERAITERTEYWVFKVHETGPRPNSKAENDSCPGMNSLIDLLGIDVGYQMIRENLLHLFMTGPKKASSFLCLWVSFNFLCLPLTQPPIPSHGSALVCRPGGAWLPVSTKGHGRFQRRRESGVRWDCSISVGAGTEW